jgi:hypothetical protein
MLYVYILYRVSVFINNYLNDTDQMTVTSRNTETSQYLPHTLYHKNAAQQGRRNPGDPHRHILQPKTSKRNFNNIFNPHLHAFPATSTLLSSVSWSQHLLPSSSHHRISIDSSVLCVHPGPVSSHISQPLVVSFDKTATTPRTEQYWQSCNSWCKIHSKAVTSIPFTNIDSNTITTIITVLRRLNPVRGKPQETGPSSSKISVLRRMHPVRENSQSTGPSSRAISGDWIQFEDNLRRLDQVRGNYKNSTNDSIL